MHYSDYNVTSAAWDATLTTPDSTASSQVPCPSYGVWPTDQPRTGPLRGFTSNDRDITYQSCSSSAASGGSCQFIFYTRSIDTVRAMVNPLTPTVAIRVQL